MGTDFPHDRLDAYRRAVELAVAVRALVRAMPRGNGALGDQLSRASLSGVLLIAEGADKVADGDKRNRFVLARGEIGETAAGIEVAAALKLVPQARADEARALAVRVASMLTKLIQRLDNPRSTSTTPD